MDIEEDRDRRAARNRDEEDVAMLCSETGVGEDAVDEQDTCAYPDAPLTAPDNDRPAAMADLWRELIVRRRRQDLGGKTGEGEHQ